MKHIVNKDHSIATVEYTINDVQYRITGTKKNGVSLLNSIDTVKNISTGEFKDFKRELLYNFTRS